MKNKQPWQQRIGYWIFIIALIPVCFELALWVLQYRPYRQTEYAIQSTPERCLISHPTLGFGLNPGTYSVTINDSLSYSVTHGLDSLRVTSSSVVSDSLPQLWLMGCSYTYGMGVNDEETFAWLLQEKHPELRVRNFGVPGFGTVQSYLQLKQLLEAGEIPGQVILNYADFHDERNVLAPRYRHALSVGFRGADSTINEVMDGSRIPFASTNAGSLQIQSVAWDSLYQDWRGRATFASVNFWQTFSDNIHQYDLAPRNTTVSLIQAMNAFCSERNIPFLVTGLTQSKETRSLLQTLDSLGISTQDISVDLSDPTYNHLPYDSHPNARAHREYAEGIVLR